MHYRQVHDSHSLVTHRDERCINGLLYRGSLLTKRCDCIAKSSDRPAIVMLFVVSSVTQVYCGKTTEATTMQLSMKSSTNSQLGLSAG